MRSKKYLIVMRENKDGTTNLQRINKGYNTLELLGLLSLATNEIIQQIQGIIKPDIIKRKVYKDN